MSDKSAIEWTDATWNPVTGCSKVSPGCKNCYAEVFAERFRGVTGHPFEQGFDLKLWPERLDKPFEWKKSRMIFVNSMSDLFHKDVPDSFIEKVFDVMCVAQQHTFQVLTKRTERMTQWVNNFCDDRQFSLPENIWLGSSIENDDHAWRIDCLQETNAQIRFLSVEPLLGRIILNEKRLRDIHWVIVGGESGHGARPMDTDWVREIKFQCEKFKVPFFFKQWGTYDVHGLRVGKKKAGRILDGRTWDALPRLKQA